MTKYTPDIPQKCDVIGCSEKPIYQQHLEVGFADTSEKYQMPPVVFVCERHKQPFWSPVTYATVWVEVEHIARKNALVPLEKKSRIVTEPIEAAR